VQQYGCASPMTRYAVTRTLGFAIVSHLQSPRLAAFVRGSVVHMARPPISIACLWGTHFIWRHAAAFAMELESAKPKNPRSRP